MGYAEEYQKKLVSADEAVKVVKSGDWVDYGWCNGTADALDRALAKRTDELTDVNVRGGILMKLPAIFEREDVPIMLRFAIQSCHVTIGNQIRRKMQLQCFR